MLAAMTREARPLAGALGLRPVAVGGGRAWDGARGLVAVIGVGPEHAAAGTQRIIDRAHPVRVLMAGVAGAVSDELAVGDLLVPAQVLDAATGVLWRPHRPPGSPAATIGTLATVARFGDPAPPGSAALDMETAAVAAVCEAAGVAWDVRRTVSDVPGGVSSAVAGLIAPDGRVDVAALVRHLARRPAEVATLGRLGRQMRTAVRALVAAVLAELTDDRGADHG